MAKESEGKELAKDVKLARRIEKEELGKMGDATNTKRQKRLV
jgi:hypothetical protein